LEKEASKEVKIFESKAKIFGKEFKEKAKNIARVAGKDLEEIGKKVKEEFKEIKSVVGNKESMRYDDFHRRVAEEVKNYEKQFGKIKNDNDVI